MKIYEILKEFQTRTTKDDIAKVRQIGANVKQANARGDADAAMRAGDGLGEILMNKVFPDMLKVIDKMVRELEVACKKYANDPAWAEQCKQLPQIKAGLEANKRQAMKDGVPLGRQDVGEGDILNTLGPAIRAIHMKDPEKEKRLKQQKQKTTTDDMFTAAIMDLIQSNKGNKEAIIAGFRDMIKNMDGFSDWYRDNSDGLAGKTLMKAVSESTTSDSVATVVGNVGTTQSRNMYNADGTMKNGLEYGNLLGGKKKSKKKKQA